MFKVISMIVVTIVIITIGIAIYNAIGTMMVDHANRISEIQTLL